MKKVVAMYEQEEAYGKNLAEYINRRESVPFEMQVFSQADKLSAYLQGHTPQLLLLSEEVVWRVMVKYVKKRTKWSI